jgi:hypothetical protein
MRSMREPKTEHVEKVIFRVWDGGWHVCPLPRPHEKMACFGNLQDAPGYPPPVGLAQYYPLFLRKAEVFLHARGEDRRRAPRYLMTMNSDRGIPKSVLTTSRAKTPASNLCDTTRRQHRRPDGTVTISRRA